MLEEKIYSIEELEVIKPYGFIYITTNQINNRKYIGQKKLTNDWRTYLGSGSLLKIAVFKHNKENFNREIIAIAYSKEELNKLEIDSIKNHNAVEDSHYYNISSGGGGGYKLKKGARNNIFRIDSLKSKQDYLSKIPNELFYVNGKSSILKNNNNDYKTLYILDFLYMNQNRRNIIKFRLKDMISDCGFMCNSRKDESIDRFKDILCNIQASKIIKSDKDFNKARINDRLECSLEINLNNNYFILYDSEKNKILNQTTVDKINNHKLFLYYSYLKCVKSLKIPFSLKQINEDLGITNISIDKYNKALLELNIIEQHDSEEDYDYEDEL